MRGQLVVGILCGFLGVMAQGHAGTASERPISVRVRQTASGPQIHVDGKPIPPRAFYGAGPSAAETLARAGILWFNEDDTRTYREDIWDYKALAGGAPTTKEQTCDLLRRNASFEILRGLGDWWMDLFGRGWYNDDDLWALRTGLASLDQQMLTRQKLYSPEIANILDEHSFHYLAWESRRTMSILLNRYMFDGCGAPYGQYLLNDVLERPIDAKLYFFAMVPYLDAAQRAKLAALRAACPDATFFWCWAPGYLSEKGMSVDGIEEVTGFRVEPVLPQTPLARSTSLGLAKGLGLKEWGGGVNPKAAPLFAPIPAPGDEVWATYRDLPSKPALVVRRHAKGTGSDIILGPGQLFRELIHAAAQMAGVHCYLESGAGNVIAAEGHVAVQNVTDKPLAVALRDGCLLMLDIPKGATRLLEEKTEPTSLPPLDFVFHLSAPITNGVKKLITSAQMTTRTVERQGTGTRIVWRGHPVCGPDFTVTADLVPTTEGDGWTYGLRYSGNESGLGVELIDFPVLTVPRTETTEILYPRACGQIRRPNWDSVKPGAPDITAAGTIPARSWKLIGD